MDLKEISLPYKFGFPLSPSNLSSQSWPRNYKKKKKTKEINSREKTREKKIGKRVFAKKSQAAAAVEENTLYLGLQKGVLIMCISA
jgi:hypothetical protein